MKKDLLADARKTLVAIFSDTELTSQEKLDVLKQLRDLAEDQIWDIKQATGIGLWRRPEDE